MKYTFLVLVMFLSGCATGLTQYNQGCREGVSGIVAHISGHERDGSSRKDTIENYCDIMDNEHRKEMERRNDLRVRNRL